MEEIKRLYKEYYDLLDKQVFNIGDLDYDLLGKHILFLKQMDAIDNSSISVFDMNRKEHIFVSDNYSRMLGYDLSKIAKQGNAFFDSKVHPDDFLVNLRSGIALLRFIYTVPVNERKDYKLVTEYRVKNARGKYIRIIEQQQVLELDKQGNIWVALSTVDISPDQDLNLGVKAQIFNFRTGEIIAFPVSRDKNEKVLTKREKQVLELIKSGMLSKEIAEELYISVHTVNTHRQRILEKLNVSSSIEAIQYLSSLGITG